jgi:nucleotide-binding universal stress UspA family protein
MEDPMLRTILVPLDGSALAERALPVALDIARRTGGSVHLVRSHVSIAVAAATAEGALLSTEMLAADEALRRRAREDTDAAARRYGAEWGMRITTHAEDGSPGAVISDAAERIGADLVVMTTHGEGGFTPGWLGSVADYVMRHSHRPVLALPENDAHGGTPFTPRSILITLDGSPHSEAILPVAQELAVIFGARVELIRVIAPYVPGDVATTLAADRPDPFGIDAVSARAKEELDAQAARLRGTGIEATAALRVQLSPTRCLLDHIKETDPDLVAIASQGRGLSRLFIGSVADKLIRAAARPVLVLRPAKKA